MSTHNSQPADPFDVSDVLRLVVAKTTADVIFLGKSEEETRNDVDVLAPEWTNVLADREASGQEKSQANKVYREFLRGLATFAHRVTAEAKSANDPEERQRKLGAGYTLLSAAMAAASLWSREATMRPQNDNDANAWLVPLVNATVKADSQGVTPLDTLFQNFYVCQDGSNVGACIRARMALSGISSLVLSAPGASHNKENYRLIFQMETLAQLAGPIAQFAKTLQDTIVDKGVEIAGRAKEFEDAEKVTLADVLDSTMLDESRMMLTISDDSIPEEIAVGVHWARLFWKTISGEDDAFDGSLGDILIPLEAAQDAFRPFVDAFRDPAKLTDSQRMTYPLALTAALDLGIPHGKAWEYANKLADCLTKSRPCGEADSILSSPLNRIFSLHVFGKSVDTVQDFALALLEQYLARYGAYANKIRRGLKVAWTERRHLAGRAPEEPVNAHDGRPKDEWPDDERLDDEWTGDEGVSSGGAYVGGVVDTGGGRFFHRDKLVYTGGKDWVGRHDSVQVGSSGVVIEGGMTGNVIMTGTGNKIDASGDDDMVVLSDPWGDDTRTTVISSDRAVLFRDKRSGRKCYVINWEGRMKTVGNGCSDVVVNFINGKVYAQTPISRTDVVRNPDGGQYIDLDMSTYWMIVRSRGERHTSEKTDTDTGCIPD